MIDQPPAIIDATYDGAISAWNGPCFPWLGAYACAVVRDGKCYIYAQRGKLTPELLAHEIKHCNGWPADHPKEGR